MKKETPKVKSTSHFWIYSTILLFGFVVGTVVYLFSPKLNIFKDDLATRNLPLVFINQGKTYAALPYPPIELVIVSSKTCKGAICNLEDAFSEIKRFLTPAIYANAFDRESPDGKKIIEAYKLKALPAFLFDKNIELIPNFSLLQDRFVAVGDRYLLITPSGEEILDVPSVGTGSSGLSENVLPNDNNK